MKKCHAYNTKEGKLKLMDLVLRVLTFWNTRNPNVTQPEYKLNA